MKLTKAQQLAKLTVKDRLAIKHFEIYLILEKKYGARKLLQRKFWQRYAGVTDAQVKILIEKGDL